MLTLIKVPIFRLYIAYTATKLSPTRITRMKQRKKNNGLQLVQHGFINALE